MDLLYEHRKVVLIRIGQYQQQIKVYYDTNVHAKRFNEGDLVLGRIFKNTKDVNAWKLGLNWEEPYLVILMRGLRSYELEDLEDNIVLQL